MTGTITLITPSGTFTRKYLSKEHRQQVIDHWYYIWATGVLMNVDTLESYCLDMTVTIKPDILISSQ